MSGEQNDAMQEAGVESAPVEPPVYPARTSHPEYNPRRRVPRMMLPALAGVLAMNGGVPIDARDQRDRAARLASRPGADARIAAAKAKRERKAAKRLSASPHREATAELRDADGAR